MHPLPDTSLLAALPGFLLGQAPLSWPALATLAAAVVLMGLAGRALASGKLAGLRPLVIPLATAATALLLFLGCRWFLWSTFMSYDDEGYVLFAIRNYSEHGSLYDRVFSQYGPFFHVFADGLHRLGWPETNIGARLLTLALWMGSSLVCLGITWRLTRNLAASCLAMAAVCIHLHQMSNEPPHPGGLIAFLLCLACLAGCSCRSRPCGFAFIAGLAAAALLLTKVNVGLLFLAGAGFWLILHGFPGIPERARRPLTAALAALMPWVLMHHLLGEAWVLEFAGVCSLSFTAAILSLNPPRKARLTPGFLAAGVAGFLLLGGCTVAILLLRGSSLHAILDGVLLSPLRMPTVYTSMIKWRPGALAWACSAPILALLARRLVPDRRRLLLLSGRLLLLVGLASSLAGLLPLNTLAFATNVALPGTWFFVAPLSAKEDSPPALSWLLLVGMCQILHAYPVAGSQLGWGSLLWMPLVAVGGHAAWENLRASPPGLRLGLARLHTRIVVVLMAFAIVSFTLIGWNRHSQGEPLDLPGAEDIVLPEDFCATARVLQGNLLLHCDKVFSLPGMFSFNLWTGLPAPTLANATHWITLLSESQKQDLLEALRRSPSVGILYQNGLLDYMRERSLPLGGAASDYLREAFSTRLNINGYQLRLRKEQVAELIGVARLRPGSEDGTLSLSLSLSSQDPVEISSCELRQFKGYVSYLALQWKESNFLVRLTPIHRDGSPRGEGRLLRPPFTMSGLNRLEVIVRNCPIAPSNGDRLLVFRNASGARVGEAFFLKDDAPGP
jgi:hypothetical protein